MKNLDFALQALARAKTDLVFTIFGPKSDPNYWSKCESIISTLPTHIRVSYAGELLPGNVRVTLSKHDLFLFPTRGENYGHVIHEALGAGLPVLISDQTPWSDVAERKVGWAHSLTDIDAFASSIDEFASWGGQRVMETKYLAMAYAWERATSAEVIEANIRLLTRQSEQRTHV